MPNRLLTEDELDLHFTADPAGKTTEELALDALRRVMNALEAQDAKTLKAVGEWLESKMVAVPLMGVEWHIRLDHIETFKQGEMPDAD